MIDHVSIPVSDLARAVRFYELVLAVLGYEKLVSRERAVGFGKRYPEFWLNLREGQRASSGAHVALRARDIAAVEAFHETALETGGTCDGPPGLRDATNPGYYAAFIRDGDGNRVEAVTFVRDEA